MTEPYADRPATLVFHKLLEGFTFGVTNYPPRRFERLLGEIKRGPGSLMSPGEANRARQGRGIIISFDDGYQHLSVVLPNFMEEHSFRPIVFIPSRLIGQVNRWDYTYHFRATPHLDRQAVRKLADLGVVFGSHGASHRDLTSCSSSELRDELWDSRRALQDLTEQEIDAISYPFGRCNQRVIEQAQEAGYRLGYTMRLPQINDHPLALGRVPVYAYDTPWSINRKLDAGPVNQIERFKTDTVNRLATGTIWLNRLRRFRP